MAKKIEKTIPWVVILSICLMTVFAGGMIFKETEAATIAPSVTVGNVVPTVGAVTLNGSAAITVVGNTSTTVVGTVTITDTNGWADISSATATLYRIGATTCTTGATADRWCYAPACTLLNVTTSNSRNASCTTNIWFLAEPTSGTSSYDVAGWEMDIMAKDAANATGFASTVQELGSIYYIDASNTISYGTVALGATSTDDKLTTIYNQGNVPFDPYLSGVDMASSSVTMAVGQQKYSSSTLGNWVGTALTGTPTGYNITLATPTVTTTDSKDDVYWMIQIPAAQLAGTYTGTNTVAAGAAL